MSHKVDVETPRTATEVLLRHTIGALDLMTFALSEAKLDEPAMRAVCYDTTIQLQVYGTICRKRGITAATLAEQLECAGADVQNALKVLLKLGIIAPLRNGYTQRRPSSGE